MSDARSPYGVWLELVVKVLTHSLPTDARSSYEVWLALVVKVLTRSLQTDTLVVIQSVTSVGSEGVNDIFRCSTIKKTCFRLFG